MSLWSFLSLMIIVSLLILYWRLKIKYPHHTNKISTEFLHHNYSTLYKSLFFTKMKKNPQQPQSLKNDVYLTSSCLFRLLHFSFLPVYFCSLLLFVCSLADAWSLSMCCFWSSCFYSFSFGFTLTLQLWSTLLYQTFNINSFHYYVHEGKNDF